MDLTEAEALIEASDQYRLLRRVPPIADWALSEPTSEVRPVIAVSSLFSFLDLPGPKDFARCVLNVVPMSQTKTAAVFSYAAPDAAPIRARLDHVLRAAGLHQRYELSRLILEHIENFVLKPSHAEGWRQARSDKIIRAFHANVTGGSVPNDPDMMLF